MTDYFIPSHNAKPGIATLHYKKQSAIDARIERLGEISDRAKEAKENGDALTLLQIAEEYETNFKHMKKTAYLLRVEAAEMMKRTE